jgi:hypothetical protein
LEEGDGAEAVVGDVDGLSISRSTAAGSSPVTAARSRRLQPARSSPRTCPATAATAPTRATPRCAYSRTARTSPTSTIPATTPRSSTAAGAPITPRPTTSSANSPATTSSGNGADTTDSGEFCDHAFDSQVARAASLQVTNPRAAATLSAGLDHQLTDRAIWLPTVTPNETDLVSRRVGNYQYNPVWGALIDQLWVR